MRPWSLHVCDVLPVSVWVIWLPPPKTAREVKLYFVRRCVSAVIVSMLPGELSGYYPAFALSAVAVFVTDSALGPNINNKSNNTLNRTFMNSNLKQRFNGKSYCDKKESLEENKYLEPDM